MQEQAGFDPIPESEHIKASIGSTSQGEAPEALQEEALRLSLEEFQEGLMQDETLLGVISTHLMSRLEAYDTSGLPDFSVKPFIGSEGHGVQIALSDKELAKGFPEATISFGIFEYVTFFKVDSTQHPPGATITKQLTELVAGRPVSKEDPPTEEEKTRIMYAATKYDELFRAFMKSCVDRGIEVGSGLSGTPELISKLERMAVFEKD